MRVVRWTLGIAYIGLGASAVAVAIARFLDREFSIGNFPPDVVAGLSLGFAAVGAFWLAPTMPGSNVVRAIGAIAGVIVGALGVWGTSTLLLDFCSVRPTGSGAPASSVPAGLGCWDVLPSLLIGGWMLTVGVLSLVALLLDYRFAGRIDGDPALD
jgi:hypothetical protein